MVDNLAVSSNSASSNARVLTLLLDTGQVSWTLGIDDTLGSAEWRSAGVTWQAGAGLVAVDHLAFGVGAAGGWLTGQLRSHRGCDFFWQNNIFLLVEMFEKI